ncbi:MAG: DUF459 domain-containing protein [Rhodospirillales bacterium]
MAFAPVAASPALAAPSPDYETRKIIIALMGDSIADGIWGGMVRILIRDRRYVLLREAKNSSGFTTSDWQAALDAVIEKKPDAIVVLFGTNDRQSLIVRDKPRSLFRSKDWEAGYIKRTDDFMDKVTGIGIPLVWVGLPIMRDEKWNDESIYLNAIFKQEAETRGVVFLATWNMTADKDGKYAPYGLDLKGDKRLLRANDGIHFTESGYDLIADRVLQTLREKFPAIFASPPAKDERPKGTNAPEASSGGMPTNIVPAPKPDTGKTDADKTEIAK